MPSRKTLSMIGLVVLIIGVVGSIISYTSSVNNVEMDTEEITIHPKDLKNIEIHNKNGITEITSTNESEIRIEYTAPNAEEKLVTEVDDSTLIIQSKDKGKKWFSFGFFPLPQTLKVFVPKEEYDNIIAVNSNGRIELSNFSAKEINLQTDNGKVTITDVQGSKIQASSSNGRIELLDVTGNDIDVSTNNGRILLENIEGNVSGKSNNGMISLKTKQINQALDFETDNGKIMIETEEELTNAVLDLKVGNGKVNVYGQSHYDTIIGDGDHLIKLVTGNGGITISKK